MHAHIILAHPEEQSFNSHLTKISQQTLIDAGWETTASDLYAMNFDPREGPQHYHSRKDSEKFHAQTEQCFNANNESLAPEVEKEIQNIMKCDLLIIHFPLWWFGMPAILKGWMDRVFVYGRMYKCLERYDNGVCRGKQMIACVTTGANENSCAFNGREGDTQMHLWPILFPFRYLGFDVFQPEVFNGVGGVAFIENHEGGLNTLEQYSNRWENTLMTLNIRPKIQYNSDTEFDGSKRLITDAPVYSPFIRQKPDTI